MRAREYDPSDGRFLETDPLACDAGCSSTYAYVDDRPTLLVDPSGEGPINSDPPVTRHPKKVRVTFFSGGQFNTNPQRGKHATWTWEKIGHPNWRVCHWDGSQSGTGPNWALDEIGHGARTDARNIASCYLSTYPWGLGKGYVYMAAVNGKPVWRKDNLYRVPVTRYYAELYGKGVWDPSYFLNSWRYSKGSPVVGVSAHKKPFIIPVSRDVARSRVYTVCTSPKLPSGGWMGIYADSIASGVEAIPTTTLKGVEDGLNECSRGT